MRVGEWAGERTMTAPGKSSLLRSGPLDHEEMPLPPGLLRLRLRCPLTRSVVCASERASEGRGVSPPGGPRRPGRRLTLLRALWTGTDVELLY